MNEEDGLYEIKNYSDTDFPCKKKTPDGNGYTIFLFFSSIKCLLSYICV